MRIRACIKLTTDNTRCDACSRCYEFTSYIKDKYPYYSLEQKRDDDAFEEYELSDEAFVDDDAYLRVPHEGS